MAALRTSSHRVLINLFSWIVTLVLITGCNGINLTATNVSPVSISQEKTQETPQAEITFTAVVPVKLAEGQNLLIEFLDEVTGLALNPVRAQMQTTDGKNFTVKIPFAIGSVLKYRYLRDNDPIGTEYTSEGQQVRYRLYSVDGPGVVNDTIAAWKNTPAVSGQLGRIQGQVANKSNNSPVVNALVTAGGLQTLTASDGSFLLEGLSPGTHNLVVYSLDGSFRAFQQGAVVAPDSTTPALIMLDPNKAVSVTFRARPPADHLKGAPVRLIGNILPLGNTFADLRGGTSVIASRAPVMSMQSDGSYSLTMKLPVGLDLRYKFTLGDGFWNAERASEGSFRTRQLIVPNHDVTVDNVIDTWKAGNFGPISFSVTVPDNTPVSDTVSIQFNPFSWTEPIPMWPTGKNRWFYMLYSPLNMFSSAGYRYCRNDQCGSADAVETQANDAKGTSFSPKDTEQAFQDTIKSWALFDVATEPVVVPGSIGARDANFQAGVEFLPAYHPSWQPYLAWAFQNVKEIGSNTVMLTPTWHVTHRVPPVIAPVAGLDPLWSDLTQMAVQAQQKGLNIAIHPVLRYNEQPEQWWAAAERSDGWWQSWFDRYQTFLLYHADLATQAGATTLVVGDESLLPALPGGTLADGSPSGVPGDADARWKKLLGEVRARYKGKLAWMIPYAGKLAAAPDFLKDDVDLLYIQLSAPLVKSDQPSQAELEASISAALDGDILKLQEKTNHPIILSIAFPSASGAFDGCVESGGNCLPPDAFQRPAPRYPGTEISLKDQAMVYSAALTVINQRSWIAGFYATGYYPPVELRDASTSTRSKPAGDVLWYWYPRLLGKATP